MKSIKTTNIFVLFVFLIICIMPTPLTAFSQERFASYENFEDAEPVETGALQAPVSQTYPIGGSVVSCTTSKDRGITIATAPDGRYGKSLKQFMTENYSENNYFEVTYSPEKSIGGSIYFESSIYLETLNYVGIRFKGDNDTKARIFPILFYSNGITPGAISVMGSPTGKNWELNTWYDIRLKWNMVTGYYEADVYADEEHYCFASGYVGSQANENYLYNTLYRIELYHLLQSNAVKETFGTKNQIAYWDNIKLETISDFAPDPNTQKKLIDFDGFTGMEPDGTGMPGDYIVWECSAINPIEAYNSGSDYGISAHINLPSAFGYQTDKKVTEPKYRLALGKSLAPLLNVAPIRDVFHFKANMKINEFDGLFSLYSDNTNGKDHLIYFYDGKIGAFGNVSLENYDANVWYDIDLKYNIKTGEYSVSVVHPSNQNKSISWEGYYAKHQGDTNFWNFFLRIDRGATRGYDENGTANLWAYNSPVSILIDNLYIGELSGDNLTVSDEYIATLDEVVSELNDSIAFYLDSDIAITQSGVKKLPCKTSANSDKFYVPVSLLSDEFNSIIEHVSDNVYINGKNVNSYIIQKDNNICISIYDYAKLCGLYVFKDDLTDLYIIGRSKRHYTWDNDRKIISGIIGQMIFDFPTSDKIISDIAKKHPSNRHPRILATNETFERIKKETGIIKSDDYSPLKNHWLYEVELKRARLSANSPVEYGPTDHIRMRQQSEIFYYVACLNSFMYKLTGDESYAKRAWLEIETICSDDFPDWNPIHLLDTGQFMNGMAVSYDWLYDWLSQEQKSVMCRAIIDKGLSVMCDIFDGKAVYSSWSDTPRSYPFYSNTDNWNFVCCGGALMAALSIFDECTGTDRYMCERVMQESVKILSYSATCFSPTGDWYEGPGYWALSNETMTEACASLLASAGTDYGIMDAPGVSITCTVPFSLIGEYTFNYSNSGEGNAGTVPTTREMFFYADRFNRDDYANGRFMIMDEYNVTPDFRDLIYCTRKFEPEPISLNTDYYLKMSEIVTMRNADVEDGLIFAGLHGGENQPAQGHLDIGQFVIDSFGDRFACDLGLEDYNLMAPYYHKYRNRAEGHNTLVINPDNRMYDQSLTGVGRIIRNEHNNASSIAVVNMTSAYTGYADSAVRGMKFINDRTSILIQDEVRGVARKLNNENEIYWFMHTKADVTLIDNNRVAVLDVNGNKMYATLLTDGYFGVMDAAPLPTSPTADGQDPNNGCRKLFIHLTDVTDTDIAVCFTPAYYYEGLSLPQVIPISEWTLDNADVETTVPRLSLVAIDGIPLDSFSPEVFSYEYPYCQIDKIPVIEAEGDGKITIELPELLPSTARIIISSPEGESIYTIALSERVDKFEDASFKKLSVQDVKSCVDNAFKTVDNDIQSYVELSSGEYVVYHLNEKSPASYVSVKGQNINASLYYSIDGVNFEYAADLTGTSDASVFSASKEDKYVKLISKSNDCVISEFNVYGFDGFEYITTQNKGTDINFITALYEVDSQSEQSSTQLSYVKVQEISLSDEFSLSDIITVPDDGKKYQASVFVWIKDSLVPIMEKMYLN